MERKLFVLLFPHNKFVDMDIKKQEEFNRCIQRRYIDKDFDFVIVNYPDCDAKRISISPSKIVQTDLTFFELTAFGKYPNFSRLVRTIKPGQYTKVVVGGFHCFDCVEKFANEVYNLNKNIVVDVDLTEFFDYYSKQVGWNEETYNPDLQLELIKSRFQDNPGSLLKRYKNPIWGISNTMLAELEQCLESHRD